MESNRLPLEDISPAESAVIPKYRIAAIDLDETLLGRDHEISRLNALAVKAMVGTGVTCVIASGRMHESTVRFADQIGIDAPIISYHGALVKHPRTKEVWSHQPLDTGCAEQVIQFCRESGKHLNYYLNDKVYVSKLGSWAHFYLRQTSSPMEEIGDLTSLVGTQPTKLILIDTPEETTRLMPIFRERFGDTVSVLKTNPEYLEFMNPLTSKGAALTSVAERLKVPREKVIAFGDGANDIEMIKWAGLGVAMGSAKQSVRDVADYIAPAFHEDGFALAAADIFGFDLTTD